MKNIPRQAKLPLVFRPLTSFDLVELEVLEGCAVWQTPRIEESWPIGPLRRFSDKPRPGFIAIVGGYAGSYICSACFKAVIGVYAPKWVCASCRAVECPEKAVVPHKTAVAGRRMVSPP